MTKSKSNLTLLIMEISKIITLGLMAAVIVLILLTSRFNSGNQYEIKRKLKLLPYWAKYIGLLISVPSIFIHWFKIWDELPGFDSLWGIGLTIGLLIIGLSNERDEDEMTMSIRLNAAFKAFFGGVIIHIIFVLIELLVGGSVESYTSLYATNFILIFYVVEFRRARKKMLA